MAAAQAATASFFTACPLNPTHRRAEYERVLGSLRAAAVIVHVGEAPEARDAARALGLRVIELFPEGNEAGIFRLEGKAMEGAGLLGELPQPAGIAYVFRTSGTTSEPKKVPITHANILTAACNLARSWGLQPSHRNMTLRALFHQGGFLGGPLVSWWAGAAAICTTGFQPARIREWLATFQPTCYSAVPAVHRAILDVIREEGPLKPGRLQWIYSGAASLPAELMRDLEQALGAAVVEGYGLTETGTHTFCNPQPPHARKARSVGISLGAEVMIASETGDPLPAGQIGEVFLRGDNVIHGYEDAPEENAQLFWNGWFRTGDLAYLDADGYLFLTGRKKEMINRGGEKIAPREVEETLLAHEAVQDAACFGVPHPRLGEEVAGAVVLRAGRQASARDLRRFLMARKAGFLGMARIYFVDALPRNAGGKVLRRELAARFANQLEPDALAPSYQAPAPDL